MVSHSPPIETPYACHVADTQLSSLDSRWPIVFPHLPPFSVCKAPLISDEARRLWCRTPSTSVLHILCSDLKVYVRSSWPLRVITHNSQPTSSEAQLRIDAPWILRPINHLLDSGAPFRRIRQPTTLTTLTNCWLDSPSFYHQQPKILLLKLDRLLTNHLLRTQISLCTSDAQTQASNSIR